MCGRFIELREDCLTHLYDTSYMDVLLNTELTIIYIGDDGIVSGWRSSRDP